MESLVMDCKFLCKREKKKSGVENPDVFQPAFSVHFCVWTNVGIACIMKPSQKTNLASSANKSTDLKINKEVIFWKQSKKFQSVFW